MNKEIKIEHTELDYRSNKYTVKCLSVLLLILFIVWLADLLKIFIVNFKLLTIGISISSAIILGTIIFTKFVDLHLKWVKYVILFLTVLSITVLGITLTYHSVLISVFPLLLAAQYSNNRVTIYTYILTVISVFTIVMGGYKWGLCDANMLIQTTDKTSYYINEISQKVNFDISKANPWVTLPLFFVVPRCLILLVFLPVIKSISLNIMAYAEYAVEMKHKSERDDLTGLYNKNKYIQMKKDVYPKEEYVGVIFWDVNNLKSTNDTLGHAKGDYLITITAQLIQRFVNENRKAYRIGGDEFVMVITNPYDGEINEILKEWHRVEQSCAESSKIPYSVAIGASSGRGKNYDEIEREADKQMYKVKMKQKSIAY